MLITYFIKIILIKLKGNESIILKDISTIALLKTSNSTYLF